MKPAELPSDRSCRLLDLLQPLVWIKSHLQHGPYVNLWKWLEGTTWYVPSPNLLAFNYDAATNRIVPLGSNGLPDHQLSPGLFLGPNRDPDQ